MCHHIAQLVRRRLHFTCDGFLEIQQLKTDYKAQITMSVCVACIPREGPAQCRCHGGCQ